MEEKIIVAVLDFGTSSIKGVIAEKTSDAKFRILNCVEVASNGCILNGYVFNMEVAGQIAQSVIRELEDREQVRINRLYANVGGQSLRTIKHIETLHFDKPHEITQEDIEGLLTGVNEFKDERFEIVSIDTPEYAVNSNYTTNPVGVQAMTLEAKYQLVVAKPKLRDNVSSVIENKLNLGIADLLIAPLVLSNTFMTDRQRELGSALIEFGAGTTTITVYRGGLLAGIRVIPIGASAITHDLTSLHITEMEAERIKIAHGSAIAEAADKVEVEVHATDQMSTRKMKRYDVCRYIEARAQEIVDNVDSQLSKIINKKELGGGVVVTGGGIKLKGMKERLEKTLGMSVEPASNIVHDDQNEDYTSNSRLHLLYAMVRYASTSCTDLALKVTKAPEEVHPAAPVTVPEVNSEYPEDVFYTEREEALSGEPLPFEHEGDREVDPEPVRKEPKVTIKNGSSYEPDNRPKKEVTASPRRRQNNEKTKKGAFDKLGNFFSSLFPINDDDEEGL